MKKTFSGGLSLFALSIALAPSAALAQQAQPAAQADDGSEDMDDDFHNRRNSSVDIVVSAGKSLSLIHISEPTRPY